LDEYLDWKGNIHPACGHHLDDTLHVEGRPDPQFAGGFVTCLACEAIERAQAEKARKDEPEIKANKFVAQAARLWQAVKVGR
jgi:S-adenosylmethionine synthetase